LQKTLIRVNQIIPASEQNHAVADTRKRHTVNGVFVRNGTLDGSGAKGGREDVGVIDSETGP
jgi:hypothetical protein